MKPVRQTKRGGADVPPEERGDCLSACLASVLEVGIEDVPVPHVDDWWDVAQAAVAAHGHRILHIGYSEQPSSASALGEWIGPVYWIAGVPSRNLGPGVGHVIVMRGSEVAHDPALGRRYPLGPLADDVPIDMVLLLLPLADAVEDLAEAA